MPRDSDARRPSALVDGSIGDLASRLRRGETTPTKLAEAALERLANRGRALNAVVTLTEERALRQAKQAEAELAAGIDRGPLHGIPWGAKDLLAVRGSPTTWGAPPLRDQHIDCDATVVERLDQAGAVLVAKLAMVEFAGGMGYDELDAQLTGPGLNPWNRKHWTGGSSTGSAAAVAARLLPFAIGSETFGSIVNPAAFCGVTGLRPTYGRVSRFGAMALSWTLDKLGPMSLTAGDSALVLQAIAGPDPRDPTAARRRFAYRPATARRSGFRLGIPKGWDNGVEPEVARRFRASVKRLEDFATVEPVRLPDLPADAAVVLIIAAECASAFEDIIEDGRLAELAAPSDRVKAYAYAALPSQDYLRAMRVRRRVAQDMARLMADYDALVTPTTLGAAPKITARLDRSSGSPVAGATGAFANLAGLPGISVPNGLSRDGLPMGLLFTGGAWQEARLIALAEAYQQRTEWHRAAPPD